MVAFNGKITQSPQTWPYQMLDSIVASMSTSPIKPFQLRKIALTFLYYGLFVESQEIKYLLTSHVGIDEDADT